MDLTILEALEITTQETKDYIDEQPVISYGETQFLNAASRMTAKNNVGVFVGSDEPVNALDGDIWIDVNENVGTGTGIKVKTSSLWLENKIETDKTFLVTIVNNGNGFYSSDKTFSDISTAILENRFVYAKFIDDSCNTYLRLVNFSADVKVDFRSWMQYERDEFSVVATINADNLVVVSSPKVKDVVLPAVTNDNNGAFLRVVDGVWSTAIISNAEEASF